MRAAHGAETKLFNWEEEWQPGGIFDLMPDAIVAVSADGRIAKVNSQLTAMFGYQPDELVGSAIEVLLPERVRAHHVRHRLGYQASPHVRPMSRRQSLYGRRKDGSEIPVDIMLSPLSSLPDNIVVAVIRDVTAAKEAAEQLKRLAYYDQLTGLPNRVALYRDLSEIIASQRMDAPLAVALFDLDGFKDVNDTMGHSFGDRLLQAIAARWLQIPRDPTKLYRLGGDEFVLVVPTCSDPIRMASVVGGMMTVLSEPFEIRGNPVVIGTSAGIAIGPQAGESIEELLASADLALYRAKAEGRGSYALFAPAMRAEAQARWALLTEVEQAFAAGELELFLQPQVRLADHKLMGAEALLRWRSPEKGVLAPAVFIEALSSSPIAPEVGQWILREGCRQANAWREAGLPEMTIAVNLFQKQIVDENLPRRVMSALTEFNLPPRLLELEISEHFSLHDDASIAISLSMLRNLGVGIALDDLGTGHASLSYLTKLPVSDVKIDQSFVRMMGSDEKSAAVVHGLVAMAHDLGFGVVAEGVETREQAEALAASGCDRAQGFLFAKPLPAERFQALAKDWTGLTPQAVYG